MWKSYGMFSYSPTRGNILYLGNPGPWCWPLPRSPWRWFPRYRRTQQKTGCVHLLTKCTFCKTPENKHTLHLFCKCFWSKPYTVHTQPPQTFLAHSWWRTIVYESSYPLPEVQAGDSRGNHITTSTNEVMDQIGVLIHHSDVQRSDTWDRAEINRIHQSTVTELLLISPLSPVVSVRPKLNKQHWSYSAVSSGVRFKIIYRQIIE